MTKQWKPRPIHKASTAAIQAETAGMVDGIQTACGAVPHRYTEADQAVTCKRCLATIKS